MLDQWQRWEGGKDGKDGIDGMGLCRVRWERGKVIPLGQFGAFISQYYGYTIVSINPLQNCLDQFNSDQPSVRDFAWVHNVLNWIG